MSNLTNDALNDEVEALTSIYDYPVLALLPSDPGHASSIPALLAIPNDIGYTFAIAFGLDYPDSPPQILGTHHIDASVKKGQGDVATTLLRDVLGRIYTPGQVCLFDLIEEVTPLLQASTQHQHHDDNHQDSRGRENAFSTDTYENLDTFTRPSNDVNEASTSYTVDGHHFTRRSESLYQEPQWTLSDPLLVNKSTFIARSLHVINLSEAQGAIAHLTRTNKRVAAATHNISAWRIRQLQPQTRGSANGGTSTAAAATATAEITIQDYDDDGETAAGGRLLHLLQLMDVWNVLVVVSRWYGGVKLGPDRFRCINAVAREAVVNAGFGGVGGEKKKGRK